jgi:hypothetical protein|uniref:Holin n=1 Tax=Podoviridae sp. ctC8s18 TaxID=2827617 RepID=A0A8S5LQW4_9CAUD|nr:MAG TPA: holin [Podoviridae sp. ctC8s18]
MEQSRTKSPIFWIGAISAVYEAFVGAGVSAGVDLPWWIGAIGTALAAFLVYATGNNPSMKSY